MAVTFNEKYGSWEIDAKVRLSDGSFRHLHRRGFRTKKEALAAMSSAEDIYLASHGSRSSSLLFSDLVEMTLERRSSYVRQSTIVKDRYMFGKFFADEMNRRASDVLTVKWMKDWQSRVISSPDVSTSTRARLMTEVGFILKEALRIHLITLEYYEDIAALLLPVRNPESLTHHDTIVKWNQNDFTFFLKAIPSDSVWFPVFATLCESGMRIGELLGIRYSDLDFDKGRIHVSGQYSVTRDYSEPKTMQSYRAVPVSDDLLVLLRRLAINRGKKGDDFLFTPENSSLPFSRTEFRRKLYFYEAKAGVPKNSPQGIRVSVSNLYFDNARTGEDIKAEARALGHSTEVAMKYYQKIQDEKVDELARKSTSFLGALVGEKFSKIS